MDLTFYVGTTLAIVALAMQFAIWRTSRTDRLLQRISEQLSALYALVDTLRDRPRDG